MARYPAALTVIASLAAFGAYTSMYAFRKPFTAASFTGLKLAGFDLKVLLVVAQLIGYTVSKFTGIKIVSEARPGQRIATIAGLIGMAFVPLVLLPFLPAPLQVFCLFINGLPLGMIWGLVFSFLEGRKVTEFLGLGMSVSFIFASGWTKSAGQAVMSKWGVDQLAMPAVTGLLFVPLLAICLWLLSQLPPLALTTSRAVVSGSQWTRQPEAAFSDNLAFHCACWLSRTFCSPSIVTCGIRSWPMY